MRHYLAAATLVLAAAVGAEDLKFAGKFSTEQQIMAPDCMALKWSQKPGDPYGCTPAQLKSWRERLVQWRTERLRAIKYDDSRYRNPALQWAATSFVQPQAMVHDRYLYDPVAGRYTVDRYLDDLERRYGGIDSVLLWSIYPNIGIDKRNQIEMIEQLPGGVAGVRQLVADFQRRGVRVLFPIMPWDTGTHALPGTLADSMVALMKQLGADGVNGDTMTGVPEHYSRSAERIGHPLVFEPEIAPKEDQLGWNLMSWGYFDYLYPLVNPGLHLSKFKWLEPRHMVHVNDRWQRNREDMLQSAFFNGIGFESWENVWGIWVGLTPRDGEALRRMATLQRAMSAHLLSPDWEPMVATEQFGVLASRWPLGGKSLWTLVNRNEYAVSGPQLALPAAPGTRYFELYSGRELQARATADGRLLLNFDIEPKGFAAVFATAEAPDDKLSALLLKMQAMTAQPLASFDHRWQPARQQMRVATPTEAAVSAPPGMLPIPAGHFEFKVKGIEVEGINMVGVDVQYPWEDSPRRFHRKSFDMKPFFIDTYPVTNAQYLQFIEASGYQPRDRQNYLRHWQGGRPSAEQSKQPVTWVDLTDARAYAQWAGKRLPTSWEWQYTAPAPSA